MSTTRYAIYYAPDAHEDLHRFGSSVLGYDAHAGATCAQLCPTNIEPSQWASLTAEPRRYGFHATLRAPFRLRDGVSERDVLAAADEAAAVCRPFDLHLQIEARNGFVALVPTAVPRELSNLEAQCVAALEPVRAPLNEAELARRLAAPLTARQTDYLKTYGYPYVRDEFRFHMTLTGQLPEGLQADVLLFLRQAFAAQVGAKFQHIASVQVFRQSAPDVPFQIIHAAKLFKIPTD